MVDEYDGDPPLLCHAVDWRHSLAVIRIDILFGVARPAKFCEDIDHDGHRIGVSDHPLVDCLKALIAARPFREDVEVI